MKAKLIADEKYLEDFCLEELVNQEVEVLFIDILNNKVKISFNGSARFVFMDMLDIKIVKTYEYDDTDDYVENGISEEYVNAMNKAYLEVK